MITVKCQQCGKEFDVWPAIIKRGEGKFCSKKCAVIYSIGRPHPINKLNRKTKIQKCKICGKGFNTKICRLELGRGKFCSNNCYYKSLIGHIPWNKFKKLPNLSEENSCHWKGDNIGYHGIHQWVKKNLGKPETCNCCGKTGLIGRKIGWANKDHKYRRNLEDWIRLCTPCHRKYDIKNNNYQRRKESVRR